MIAAKGCPSERSCNRWRAGPSAVSASKFSRMNWMRTSADVARFIQLSASRRMTSSGFDFRSARSVRVFCHASPIPSVSKWNIPRNNCSRWNCHLASNLRKISRLVCFFLYGESAATWVLIRAGSPIRVFHLGLGSESLGLILFSPVPASGVIGRQAVPASVDGSA